MTTLIIADEQERQIADLIALAHSNPLTREYLARMSVGFDTGDPSTRREGGEVIPLHFTIDLPIGVRFTYTEEDQPAGPCRHMSVSIDKVGAIVAPPVVDMLLECFRFTCRRASDDRPLMIWPEHYASGRVAVNVLEIMPAEATAS